MGLIIAAIYVAAALLIPPMSRRWLLFGLAYGVIIFFIMNYLIVSYCASRQLGRLNVESR